MPPSPSTSAATASYSHSPSAARRAATMNIVESPPWTRANAAAAAALAASTTSSPALSEGGRSSRTQRSAARTSQTLTRQVLVNPQRPTSPPPSSNAPAPKQPPPQQGPTPSSRSRRPSADVATPAGTKSKPKPPPPGSLAATVGAGSTGSANHPNHPSPLSGAAIAASASPSRTSSRRKRSHAETTRASLKPSPSKRARHSSSNGATASHSRTPKAGGHHPGRLKAPPNAKNDADYETEVAESSAAATAKNPAPDDPATEPEFNCCICMTEPEKHELSNIDGCDHRFCFPCIAQWSERENTCPLCKHRFHKICRVHPIKGGAGGGRHPHRRSSNSSANGKPRRGRYARNNTKTVKNRDQRADFVGAGLEGLLQSMAAAGAGGNAPFNIMASAQFRSFIMSRIGGPGTVGGGGGGNSSTANAAHANAGGAAGLTGTFTVPPSAPAAASARYSFAVHDNYFDDDDESDDDEEEDGFNPFTFFLRTSRFRAAPFAASVPVPTMAVLPIHGGSVFAGLPVVGPPPPRSYAINANDRTAGSNLQNPLEIPDSDDEDNNNGGGGNNDDSSDEVQVVEMPRIAGPVPTSTGTSRSSRH